MWTSRWRYLMYDDHVGMWMSNTIASNSYHPHTAMMLCRRASQPRTTSISGISTSELCTYRL